MNTRKMTAAIDTAFRLFEAAAGQAGVDRAFDRALRFAVQEEKEHRSFGSSFTGGRNRYRLSVTNSAKLFVVQNIADPWPVTCAKDVLSKVPSALLGAAIRQVLDEAGMMPPAESYADVLQIDYARDVAYMVP